MTVYVDTDALKASLTLAGTTFADDDIDAAAIAASGAVEQEADRDFGKSASAESRLFESDSWSLLACDDLVSVTTLETDSAGDGTFEEWDADEYRLEPLNASAKRKPYTRVRATTRSFPAGRLSTVRITGIFGWPSVPPQVTEVATLLATQLVKRKRDMPMGFQITLEGAVYVARNDPQIAALWRGLSRRSSVRSASVG